MREIIPRFNPEDSMQEFHDHAVVMAVIQAARLEGRSVPHRAMVEILLQLADDLNMSPGTVEVILSEVINDLLYIHCVVTTSGTGYYVGDRFDKIIQRWGDEFTLLTETVLAELVRERRYTVWGRYMGT